MVTGVSLTADEVLRPVGKFWAVVVVFQRPRFIAFCAMFGLLFGGDLVEWL